jgi:hypothetical protein
VNRHDLLTEPSGIDVGDRALVTAEGEGVALLSRDSVQRRYFLSSFTH